MNTFDIARRGIGGSNRCFVIAEAGVNHNGDVALAGRLIDAAADAGADAIKFQTFTPEQLASPSAQTADYQRRTQSGDQQLQMLEKLVLDHSAYPSLKERAAERGLVFLSTPFDTASADFLFDLGVPAFKVSSGDLTHSLLLRHLARKGRPIILSSGMATLAEVQSAIDTIAEVTSSTPGIAVLQCVSNYPADIADSNLRAIPTMAAALDCPIGFSDHTTGEHAAVAAVALGAAIIEKHITLDRSMTGPDHQASLNPAQFKPFVTAIREAEASLGSGEKIPASSERDMAAIGRRSLFWQRALERGTRVSEDDLIALRPGTGLAANRWREIVGRVLTRSIAAGQAVAPDDVE
ncbi:MAG TPA: N-acetylneuraminate synthase family protein [Vicinamibacterales bacterium]|nr:N-acetylneuraminate synthase family protein [Vicinamibacterales bacterium]